MPPWVSNFLPTTMRTHEEQRRDPEGAHTQEGRRYASAGAAAMGASYSNSAARNACGDLPDARFTPPPTPLEGLFIFG